MASASVLPKTSLRRMADQANPEIAAQLNRLRLLHVETGLLLERMKGEADRRAAVA